MIIQELVAKLGLDIDEGTFAVGEKMIAGVRKGLLGIGVALGAYVGGIQALIQTTANAAFAASKAAQATGLSAEAIQELTEAADDSGMSAEQLEGGLRRLARAAYDASQGTQEAQDTFADLGVSIYDVTGKLKGPDVLLQDIAAKFHDMPDGMRKTALAQRAFGRSGAELLRFLNQGGDAIERAREEAHAYGTILSGETLAAAEDYRLANDALGDSLRGLGYEIAGPLLTGAGDLANALAELIRENRTLIASAVRRPFELMRKGVEWLAKNVWLLKLAMVGFTSYLLLTGIPALVTWALTFAVSIQSAIFQLGLFGIAAKVAGAISAAAGAMATAGWIAGIALAILLFDDLITTLQGGDSLLGRLMQKTDEWFKRGDYDPHKTWLGQLGDYLRVMWVTVTDITRAFEEWGKIFTGQGPVASWLKKTAQDMLGGGPMADMDLGQAQNYVDEAVRKGVPAQQAIDYLRSMGAAEAVLGNVWSPAASSPVASVASSVAGGGSVVNAQKFEAQFSIQATPNMDTRELAHETSDRLAEWFNNELQQSVPAVAPNR